LGFSIGLSDSEEACAYVAKSVAPVVFPYGRQRHPIRSTSKNAAGAEALTMEAQKLSVRDSARL